MSLSLYTQLLDLACGAFLLAAVVVLWRRELVAIVRVFALQGVALAAIALLLGVHEERWDLVAVAAGIGVLRAGVLPYLMRRALVAVPAAGTPGHHYEENVSETRETQPLVNVAASLLTAAALTLLAYAVARPLVALDPTPATRALPVGLAVVLIGFFVLVTRRRALAQVVGFLLLDNGITATAFLAASGVPLIVELGVSFDVLLAVLVLQILTTRMRAAFGGTDIDDLRELHD
jgi:hydrogenase-4 component E